MQVCKCDNSKNEAMQTFEIDTLGAAAEGRTSSNPGDLDIEVKF